MLAVVHTVVQFMAAFARVNRVGMNSSIWTKRHVGLAPTTIPERFPLWQAWLLGGLMITSFIPDALRFLQKKPSDLPLLLLLLLLLSLCPNLDAHTISSFCVRLYSSSVLYVREDNNSRSRYLLLRCERNGDFRTELSCPGYARSSRM